MVKTPIDRCYYLRLCQDNQVIASYFIRPGEMLAVHVPLGSYTVYYAFSSQSAPWISEQELWGSHTVYYKFRDKFDFCRDGDTYQGRNIDFANLNYYAMKGHDVISNFIFFSCKFWFFSICLDSNCEYQKPRFN